VADPGKRVNPVKREASLVFLLGRTNPSGADLDRAATLLAARGSALDLDALRLLVRANKVLPSFLHNLRRLPDTLPDRVRRLPDTLPASPAPLPASPDTLPASPAARGDRSIVQRVLDAFAVETDRFDLAGGRERAIEKLAHIRALLGEYGNRVMVIKGLGLAFLIPDYRLRSLNDLDLLFPDFGTLSLATRHLERNGFAILEGGEAPFVCWTTLGPAGPDTLIGHFTLDGLDSQLDMHAVNLAVTGCSLPALDYWPRAWTVEVGGQGLLVPAPEDALIMLLIHATDHGYLTLKDANDAYALLAEHGERFDWTYLVDRVVSCHLDRLLSYVLELLGRDFAFVAPIPEELARRLRSPGRPERRLGRVGVAWVCLSWLGRGRLTGQMGREYAGQVGGHPSAPVPNLVLRQLLLAARRTHEERWLGRLANRLLRPSETGPHFGPLPPKHFPVYLTEISPELQAAWVEETFTWDEVGPALEGLGLPLASFPESLLFVVRDGDREVVVSPAGLLIPTLNFTFAEKELKQLAVLGTRILSGVRQRKSRVPRNGPANESPPVRDGAHALIRA